VAPSTCTGHDCSSHANLIHGTPESVTCSAATCTDLECCTVIPDVDCAGSWSACTDACEAAGVRSWTETAAQSGTGTACPTASPACQPGDDACPLNTDCTGSWSACTDACEGVTASCYETATTSIQADRQACTDSSIDLRDRTACDAVQLDGSSDGSSPACTYVPSRTWTEGDAQSGTGAPCPDASPCQVGDGACANLNLNLTCSQWWENERDSLQQATPSLIRDDINPCHENYPNTEFDINLINSRPSHGSLSDSCCKCPTHQINYELSSDGSSCNLVLPFDNIENFDNESNCGEGKRISIDSTSNELICEDIVGECSNNFDETQDYIHYDALDTQSPQTMCPQYTQPRQPCMENQDETNCIGSGNCSWHTLRPENQTYLLDEIGRCISASPPDLATCCVDRINYCFNSKGLSGNTQILTLSDYSSTTDSSLDLCEISTKSILTDDENATRGLDTSPAAIKLECCMGVIGECSGNSNIQDDIVQHNPSISSLPGNMCPDGFTVHNPCYEITDELSCNAAMTTSLTNYNTGVSGAIQRCEYKNGNCYPISSGPVTSELCCEQRTGYCINNFDIDEDFDSCPDDKTLTIDEMKTKGTDEITNCCENRSGYCKNNTDSTNDLDCSSITRDDGTTVIMINKPTDEICIGRGENNTDVCNEIICCDSVSDKCTGNTDTTNDFVCSSITGGTYINRDGVCIDTNSTIIDSFGVATCSETSTTTVAADAANCAVSGMDLNDSTECMAVQLDGSTDDTSPACTYTPEVRATASNCNGPNSWVPYADIDSSINVTDEEKCCRLLPDASTCGGFTTMGGCGDNYNIKPNSENINIENSSDTERRTTCCDTRSNYCKLNTIDTDDFDCSITLRVFKDNAEDTECGTGSPCDIAQCCVDITDKCSGNTDPTHHPEIVCGVLGKYVHVGGVPSGVLEIDNTSPCTSDACGLMDDKPNKSTISLLADEHKQTCCSEINHKCGDSEGSTVPFDCTTEIEGPNNSTLNYKNKQGDITCTDANGPVDCRNINGPVDAANQCCDIITGMCSGNTDESENIDCGGPTILKSLTNGRCFNGDNTEGGYTTKDSCEGVQGGNYVWKLPNEISQIIGDRSEIDDLADHKIDNCCEIISGFCAGNTPSTDNSSDDITCPIGKKIKEDNNGDNIIGRSPEVCCEIRGNCFGNTVESDFECSSPPLATPMENNIPASTNGLGLVCPDTGCTPLDTDDEPLCCKPITGKCSGNTNPTENITCTDIDSNSILKDNPNSIDRGGTVGEHERNCCKIPTTNYCIGNTDSSEDFDDNKCNSVMNPGGTLSAFSLITDTVGPGWETMYPGDLSEEEKGTYCCTCSGCISSSATFVADQGQGTQRFTNMEGFTNFKELINIDKGNMIIEGLTNDEVKLQCDLIRTEMLSGIDIPESQFQFTCSLSEDEKYINVNTSVVPLEGEELPEEIVAKVTAGLPVLSFKRAKKKDDEGTGGTLTKILLVITVLILIVSLIIIYT